MLTKIGSKAPTGSSPCLFLKGFLRYGKRVASIAPSSRALASAVCAHVDPTRPQTILELGAGTGAVTVVAANRMHPKSRLIAVEIDREFARVLTARCPEATIVRADVRDLPQQLAKLGVDHFDLMLNGLPTPSLPYSVNSVVFETFAAMGQDSWFSQITVMPWLFKPTYCRLFEDVQFRLVAANLPPGGVYHCRKLRPEWPQCLPGKPPVTA